MHPPPDTPQSVRDALLSRLRDLLGGVASAGDPTSVVSGDALALARDLWLAAADTRDDLEIRHAIGWLYWHRHEVIEDELSLRVAIACLRKVHRDHPGDVPASLRDVLESAPGPTPGADLLDGARLLQLALADDDEIALDAAIEELEELLGTLPEGDPRRAAPLSNLSMALRARFRTRGGRWDLDRSVTSAEEAVEAVAADDPDRLSMLDILGLASFARFTVASALPDLDRAIATFDESATACSEDHDRVTSLNNLGNALSARFEATRRRPDLDRAIAIGEEALQAAPRDDPRRPVMLSNVAASLMVRFETTGGRADLDRALANLEEVVGGGGAHAGSLANLGLALFHRFELTHDRADLDRAVSVGEQAVEATPAGHPDRPRMLRGLAATLRGAFELSRQSATLDRAVALSDEALAATPPSSPTRGAALAGLAVSLYTRFEATGQAADLDKGIAALEALAATPRSDPSNAMLLAYFLWKRFEVTGERADVERAVSLAENAASELPPPDAGRIPELPILGIALNGLFSVTRQPEHIDQAIAVLDAAIAHEGGPTRAAILSLLGAALGTRFALTRDRADLDRAVEVGEAAVAEAGDDRLQRAIGLSNFTATLTTRFELWHDRSDLERAVASGQAAVSQTTAGDPRRAAMLANVGRVWRLLFEQSGNRDQLRRAAFAFREAADVASAPPLLRAKAAADAGALAVTARDLPQAIESFAHAVSLLARVAPRRLGRADQEVRLAELTGLGQRAAAACLEAGLQEQAVELFEHSRGILFAQALDAHTELTDLELAHPELADELRRWRDELDRPEPLIAGVSPTVSPGVAQAIADRRRNAANQFEQVLEQIRTLHGFERFMSPRPVSELMAAAAEGPVVLVNVSALRSDAMILTARGVDAIPLDGVNPDAVIEQLTRFVQALDDVRRASSSHARLRAEASLLEVLSWLGHRITRPVLDHLGHVAAPPPGATWPRVWWCPSGLLSLLPLHAAGDHAAGDRNAVIDRVVSSTTPTVRALLHARRPVAETQSARVLVVAMARTPGHADLPGADQEAATIEELFVGRVDVLGPTGNPPATFDAVMTAISDHQWVHFACHGHTDLVDPSASLLLLADHSHRPFTVLDLIHARLQGVEFAFLSACTTAQTAVALPDEAIHLAAGALLAGYRQVIGTLWWITDADTVWLTEMFYGALTAAPPPSPVGAARALHEATRELRFMYATQPSRWAAYTHVGA